MIEQLDLLALVDDQPCQYGWTPEQRAPQICDNPATVHLHWAVDLLAATWLFWPGASPRPCYGRGMALCPDHVSYYGTAWASRSQLVFVRPATCSLVAPSWPVTGWEAQPEQNRTTAA